MKKILLVIAAVLTASVTVEAQSTVTPKAKKFFMAVSGGPAIPIGAFAAKSVDDNSEAGLAKLGYNFNLDLGYCINTNTAFAVQLFYAKHALNDNSFKEVGVTTDHWQYYGALAGPALSVPAGKKVVFDIRTMGGVARVNSPLFQLNSTVLVGEAWSTTFAMQLGADVRYNFAGNMFLFGNAGYNYMRPKFTIEYNNGEGTTTTKTEQKIDVITVNAGVGVRF